MTNRMEYYYLLRWNYCQVISCI